MNIDFSTISAGTALTITLTDDTVLTGTYKGTNSKGVRIVLDGATKETTRSLSKIVSATVTGSANPDELGAVLTEDGFNFNVEALSDEDFADMELDDEEDAYREDDEDQKETDELDYDYDYDRDENLDEVPTVVVSADGVEAADLDAIDAQDAAAADVTLDNADLEAIQQIIDSITEGNDEDGYTSGELAAIFGDSAYNLRKVFRKLGMGVGKGSRYQLGAKDVKKVYDALN